MTVQKEIANAIKRSYYQTTRNPTVSIPKLFAKPSYDLVGEKLTLVDVKLSGCEFEVIDWYMLINTTSSLKIYTWASTLKVRFYKKLKYHLLNFMAKKMNKRVRRFFYKVFLELISSRVKRAEAYLEGIMIYLNVDELVDVNFTCHSEKNASKKVECEEVIAGLHSQPDETSDKASFVNSFINHPKNTDITESSSVDKVDTSASSGEQFYVICYYKNGVKKVFDDLLAEVTIPEKLSKYNEEIRAGSYRISICTSNIKISYPDRSFVNLVQVENVRQYVAVQKYLFLMTTSSLQVLVFNQ